MKHVEGTFKGIRDSHLYYQGWFPGQATKAVLLLVHGLGEYCGRYTNLVERFVPLGYAVYGVDHLGHGKSEGEREVIVSLRDFSEPLSTFYNMVKSWEPAKPIFIYGHSMGGLITAYYLLDHQDEFTGAIISSPGVKIPDNMSPLTVFMGKVLSKVAPKTGILSLDPRGISRDPAVVEAYINDRLVFHGKTPARLGAEMLQMMLRVTAEFGKVTLPFIAIQGSGDRIVDPEGARMLYEKAGSSDKTLKIYEGFYHELHNEPDRETVFKDVEGWLKAHA